MHHVTVLSTVAERGGYEDCEDLQHLRPRNAPARRPSDIQLHYAGATASGLMLQYWCLVATSILVASCCSTGALLPTVSDAAA